jgi:type IV secretory pathway VirB10-like protein
MLPNRLAFAGLALACIAAAAGGGYFAARQTVAPTPTQAATITDRQSAPLKPEAAQTPEAPVPEPNEPNRKSPSARPSTSSTSFKSNEPVAPTNRFGSRTASTGIARRVGSAAAAKSDAAADHQTPVGSGASSLPASSPTVTPTPAEVAQAPRVDDRILQEPTDPPQKSFEELTVVADSVIGLQAQTSVTSDQARIEDRVEARVSRDVRVHERVAIPAGSRALGTVVSVERGGKFKERARLGIRFNTLVLSDGTRIPISTDTIYREGNAPGRDSTSKMTGAAVGGAILGAIIGGGKGAAIGGAVGAGAGAAATAAGDRSQAALYSGEPITVRLLAPVSVTIECRGIRCPLPARSA